MTGGEDFTSIVDLVQTHFHCCGVTDHYNYSNVSINFIYKVSQDCSNHYLHQTTWRAQIQRGQDLGQSRKLVNVPLTCCVLQNNHQDHVFLDPVPINHEKCQDTSEVTGRYRHVQVNTVIFPEFGFRSISRWAT